MSLKLPKYVTPVPRKDGSQRFYFHVPDHMRPKDWPRYVRLPDDVGEMFRHADLLYKRLNAQRGGVPADVHAEGSLPWLLQRYHQSAPYKGLAPRTRELWDGCAKEVLKWSKKAGHPPISRVDRPTLFEFLELFDDKPSKKKNIATFLRALFEYAFNIGKVPVNPATNMRVKVPDPKVHIWTDAEILKMVKAADDTGYADIATAILIGADIGQRQADILKMEYGRDYADGLFLFAQNKTGEIMQIEATERLAARLRGRAAGRLVPQATHGLKHPRQHFLKRFVKVADGCGLSHCIFAKLRHTAIVGLARAGCTAPEIAAVSGHTVASVAAILRKYLPRDTKVAQNAIRKLEISRKTDGLSG